MQLDHVGLNHLTWERAARVDGVDRLPEILAGHVADLAEDIELPAEPAAGSSAWCRRTTCATSTPTTRWCASCCTSESRPSQVTAIEHELLRMYADPTLDEKPELLEQRGGAYYSEAAVQLAAALLGSGDTTSTQVVNVRNDGTLPFLPDDAVIEVPAEVDRAGRAAAAGRAARAAVRRTRRATSRRTSTSPSRPPCTAATTGSSRRCWRTRSSARSTGPTGSTDRLIAHNRDYLPWA